MRSFWFTGFAAIWANTVFAGAMPVYAPPPAWVAPLPFPKLLPASDAQALQILLHDRQIAFTPDNDQIYEERVVRIAGASGLAALGNIQHVWNPETDTLTIHTLKIVRGDKTIDLLAGGKTFTVLRRETNLEMAALDGNLTATLQPEGLQVGDILDMAFSLTHRDPVYQGMSEAGSVMFRPGLLGRVRFRAVWPVSKAIRWKATLGLGSPALIHPAKQTELVFDASNTEAPKAPAGAPARYYDLGQVQFSQFASWSDVAALMRPLYVKASTLDSKSPLLAEISRIKAVSSRPKQRAALALQFVQDKVRYLYLGMNAGGYVPADADVTWRRRFGDCKGKTSLLLALLHGLDIDAEPTLVSTSGGDGLDQRLPVLGVFDHVIVRAQIEGKTYWLDGTRMGDRDLDNIQPPAFKWVLPVKPAASILERIDQPTLRQPRTETLVRIDASAGIDAAAPSHLERLYRGDRAIGLNLGLSATSPSDVQRYLKEYWTGLYPWITARTVSFAFDSAENTLRYLMDGDADMAWTKSGTYRRFDIAESSLGSDTAFRREPGPYQDAPFAVSHPDYGLWTVIVTLPDKGRGFSLTNAEDIERVAAGVDYKRTSRVADGVVTMTAIERSVAPEFPAADAPAAATTLRELAQTDVNIVKSSLRSEMADADADETQARPDDAAGFNRRAVAWLMKRDYDKAIVDFTAAIKLEPTVAKHLYNRGVARLSGGDRAGALGDFDAALKLNPADSLAMGGRATVLLRNGDRAGARQAFDSTARLSADPADALLRAATSFEEAEMPAIAAQYYDRMAQQAPGNTKLADKLNATCWNTATSGAHLEWALAACDAALKLTPSAAKILDSRAFAELRLGQYDNAIKDYTASLASRTDDASGLYGRGLARLRKGMKTEGNSDIAAALAQDPTIEGAFAAWGVPR